MNKKEQKTIELIQSETVKVLEFFEKSVIEMVGNEKYITVDFLIRIRNESIGPYVKGLLLNGDEKPFVLQHMETAINTLINTSKRGDLEYVNIDDFKRASPLTKISVKMPVEQNKSSVLSVDAFVVDEYHTTKFLDKLNNTE